MALPYWLELWLLACKLNYQRVVLNFVLPDLRKNFPFDGEFDVLYKGMKGMILAECTVCRVNGRCDWERCIGHVGELSVWKKGRQLCHGFVAIASTGLAVL